MGCTQVKTLLCPVQLDLRDKKLKRRLLLLFSCKSHYALSVQNRATHKVNDFSVQLFHSNFSANCKLSACTEVLIVSFQITDYGLPLKKLQAGKYLQIYYIYVTEIKVHHVT